MVASREEKEGLHLVKSGIAQLWPCYMYIDFNTNSSYMISSLRYIIAGNLASLRYMIIMKEGTTKLFGLPKARGVAVAGGEEVKPSPEAAKDDAWAASSLHSEPAQQKCLRKQPRMWKNWNSGSLQLAGRKYLLNCSCNGGQKGRRRW